VLITFGPDILRCKNLKSISVLGSWRIFFSFPLEIRAFFALTTVDIPDYVLFWAFCHFECLPFCAFCRFVRLPFCATAVMFYAVFYVCHFVRLPLCFMPFFTSAVLCVCRFGICRFVCSSWKHLLSKVTLIIGDLIHNRSMVQARRKKWSWKTDSKTLSFLHIGHQHSGQDCHVNQHWFQSWWSLGRHSSGQSLRILVPAVAPT
jgi:hypothetical protein